MNVMATGQQMKRIVADLGDANERATLCNVFGIIYTMNITLNREVAWSLYGGTYPTYLGRYKGRWRQEVGCNL
jgi:hypothetical protein